MLRYVEAEVERRVAMFGEKDVRDILNIPSRLALRVCRNVDSLTLIDESGAEDLLVRGDALFKDEDSEAIRLQVPCIPSHF